MAATASASRGALIRYDAACRAIAQAKRVDEAKQIRAEAIAMRAYARQAKNRQLETDAIAIRKRAERRVGQLMKAQSESVGLSRGKPGPGRGKAGSPADPAFGVPTLREAGIDKHLADRARKLAAMPEARFEDMVANIRTTDDQPKSFTAHQSESPEHYTPSAFLDGVIEVFGAIDLDPACESRERPNVPAQNYYTREDDGLAQPWMGRVFLNPPYGREIATWITKLRAEWRGGQMTELIALLPARTDTEWFKELTGGTDDAVVCFLHGRLTFVGNTNPAPFPSMAVYFGPHHDVFARVFNDLGSLWVRPGSPLEWFVEH